MTYNVKDLMGEDPRIAQAFVHKSFEGLDNFEKLEFLGDSILGSRSAELLYLRYDEASEGDLSRWKSALVSQTTLSKIARQLKLQEHLVAASEQEEDLKNNERIQASILEALIGALHLVKGAMVAQNFIDEVLIDEIEKIESTFQSQDPKTLLQEQVQALFKETPMYHKVSEEGPSHSPTFTVAVSFVDVMVKAKSSSLKNAEREAAAKALKQINGE